MIRDVYPDLYFLPIPDPGSRGQKGTGSRIRNSDHHNVMSLSTSNRMLVFRNRRRDNHMGYVPLSERFLPGLRDNVY